MFTKDRARKKILLLETLPVKAWNIVALLASSIIRLWGEYNCWKPVLRKSQVVEHLPIWVIPKTDLKSPVYTYTRCLQEN